MTRRILSFFCFALCAAMPSLFAQSTVGSIFRLDLPGNESQLPDVATGRDGELVVVWREAPAGAGQGVFGRRVSGEGEALAGELVIEAPQPGTAVGRPRVAVDGLGRFVVAWGASNVSESCAEAARFDPLGALLGRLAVDSCSVFSHTPAVSAAATPTGEIAVAWDEQTGVAALDRAVFFQPFTATAQPRGGPVRVAQGTAGGGIPSKPSLALDASGRPAVVWEAAFPNRPATGALLRLYDSAGRPRSGEIPLTPSFPAHRAPALASSAAGRLAAAWDDGVELGVRLFTPDGEAFERIYYTGFDEIAPHVGNADLAADSLGNFVVVWEETGTDSFGPEEERRPHIVMKVFNNRRAPKTGAMAIYPDAGGSYTSPAVALQEDGTFLVVWESRPPGGPSRIVGQLFQQPESVDFCIYRDKEFRCATQGGGWSSFFNEPVQFGNGLAAGDRPFLADVNGNGDDDPCIRRGGQFLCDTAHDGGAPEVVLAFGSPGHVPLFGDLDGDGDDDPCVRRGRTFLCDTAHDGGEAEARVLFGLAADIPLLGDVDGDGDDDPCLYRPSTSLFLCDADHDGARDFVLAVQGAQPGDRPLMTEVGGPGDAFLLVRGKRLLRVSRVDGNLFEAASTTGGRDYILLGNIDGF